MTERIRRLSYYWPVITVIDGWWRGRHMTDKLPRLFFEHFTDTGFRAVKGTKLQIPDAHGLIRHHPRRTTVSYMPGLRAEGARIMDTDAKGFPSGDLRVSDADRDRALSELSEAFQVGRITADEFGQRSGQILRARTGKELTVPLADLPLDHPSAARATAPERDHRIPATRITIGASVAAIFFASVAAAAALSSGPSLQQRELMREMLARQGLSASLPPAAGFNWPGTITPGAIAVLLVVLIIYLRVTRANRP